MGQWIDKIGVEVECATFKEKDDETPITYNDVVLEPTGDGSLRREWQDKNVRLVEYVSTPVKYPDELDDLRYALEELYESRIAQTNHTMGLHVHFSINKDGWTSRLCSQKFADFFWTRLEQSDLYRDCYRLRDRMDGYYPKGTNYAKPIPDHKQIDRGMNGGGGRYYFLNYSALGKHKTIECRIFPSMITANHVMEAVDVVTTNVNAFLKYKHYKEDIGNKLIIQKPEMKKKKL